MTKFVNPESIIAQLTLPQEAHVADFGCGSGFYSLALAGFVGEKGSVYAIDILPGKLEVTDSSARLAGFKNITVVRADLEEPLTSLNPGSCDMVVMSNIMHQVGASEKLLENAYRVLKTAGQLLVVDWKKERSPFGPPMETRVSREAVSEMVTKRGLRPVKDLEADGYHYAMLFVK